MLTKTIVFCAALSLICNPASGNLPVQAENDSMLIANKQSTKFEPHSPKELVDEVWQITNSQFVDPDFNGVDWQQVRQDYVLQRSYDDMTEAYAAIEKMLDLLGDPLNRFLTPKEFGEMRIKTSSDKNSGIGLRMTKDKATGKIHVEFSYPGSPAFDAGINHGDIITAVDRQSTRELELHQIVSWLQGELGTTVNLTIERNGKTINLDVERAIVKIEPVQLKIKRVNNQKLAYIKLDSFNASASKDMKKAIAEAETQNVQGYVLDLRGNSGGLLYSAIDIARMWLNEGTVVAIANRQGIQERKLANGKALTDKPLAVLVNQGTASGSEILVAALQENKRATVIGEQTNGAGSIQSVRPVGNGSGLAVTIAKFLTPNGNSVQGVGIEPDVKVKPTAAEKASFYRNPQALATQNDLLWTEGIKALKAQL